MGTLAALFALTSGVAALASSSFANDEEAMKEWKNRINKGKAYQLRAIEQYKKDANELGKFEFFKLKSGGKSDAGPFLNPKFFWADDGPKIAELAIPDELRNELNKVGKGWVDWKPDWKKWKLNFEWMAKLKAFDHWNIDENNPEYFKTPRGVLSFSPPIYNDLYIWAKLRILKGRDEKNVSAALDEVESLAKLVFSHEDKMALLFGSTINTFVEVAVHALKVDRKTIPQELKDTAKRFLYSGGSFANPDLPADVWNESMKLEPGFCGRVFETLKESFEIKAYLDDYAKDYLSRLNKLEEESRSSCRKSLVRKLWRDPKYSFFEENERFIMTSPGIGGVSYGKSPEDVKERKKMQSTPEGRQSMGRMLLLMRPGFSSYKKVVGEK